MSEDIKWMDIREFYEEGYLQEANRQFFHPLGLALAVELDDDDPDNNPVIIKGVWDYRDDPEGNYFGFGSDSRTADEEDEARIKCANVETQRWKLTETRKAILGFDIEPIPPYES